MPPAFNFQFVPAPVSVLLFLGAALCAVAVGLTAGGLLLARRRGLAGLFLLLGVAGGVAYGALLYGSALASHEVLIPPGGEKYFCELDCHLAYALLAVERPATLGPVESAARPNGRWLILRLRTRFDATTISAGRGDAPLYPNPRRARLLDARGRRYEESAAGRAALAAAGQAGTPLAQPLRPGESYVSALVFDVPADAEGLRLLLGEADAVTGFLVGHENSPGHRKAFFELPG